ncbi:MAG TPA: DUF3592 domain-containing protein [Terriglobales bacterium]|nr:DUF3592 domain-containing protein [Terriglobales bacterium]
MATSEKHGTLQFLGVAFLIIAGLFAIFSLSFFWQQIQVLRSWPVRQAQVIRSQVVVLPTGKHDQIYAAKLEIAYAVNGKLVTAELTSFQSSNYQATLRRAALFPAGSRCAIRYDPRNPKAARIGAGWNRRFFAAPLIALGCGLFFAAVAAGFFLTARFAHSESTAASI